MNNSGSSFCPFANVNIVRRTVERSILKINERKSVTTSFSHWKHVWLKWKIVISEVTGWSEWTSIDSPSSFPSWDTYSIAWCRYLPSSWPRLSPRGDYFTRSMVITPSDKGRLRMSNHQSHCLFHDHIVLTWKQDINYLWHCFVQTSYYQRNELIYWIQTELEDDWSKFDMCLLYALDSSSHISLEQIDNWLVDIMSSIHSPDKIKMIITRKMIVQLNWRRLEYEGWMNDLPWYDWDWVKWEDSSSHLRDQQANHHRTCINVLFLFFFKEYCRVWIQ